MGLPLGSAAAMLGSAKSRGRHGNALQWHLGLAPHDGDKTLDWEDRIEVKLVSVWRARRQGGVRQAEGLRRGSLSVAQARERALGLRRSHHANRRGRASTTMAGRLRERLAATWDRDPHFEQPDLFVEARDGEAGPAPAYYLAATWFAARSDLAAELAGDLRVRPATRESGPRADRP